MTNIDPQNLFGFLVQDIARLMSRTFSNKEHGFEVTRAQARVLAYVSLLENANQTEIAALMDIQKIALTRLVDGLEGMGLLERRPDPDDRRVRRLYMPAKAKRELDNIWRHLSDISDLALTALPADRRKAFIQDLVTIRLHLITENTSSTNTADVAYRKLGVPKTLPKRE
ncbi:MAG: MarR family winged helix-turn-helix transcriptional regulator [Parvibaculaceae bacterium]|nr:MarR family winged helix-turn-helix transcriptional regulator [Parvibaculaceae bacterium]